MVPDVLGFKLDEGIGLLTEWGLKNEDIEILEYTSPKGDIIGNNKRIVRVDSYKGKILLLAGNF